MRKCDFSSIWDERKGVVSPKYFQLKICGEETGIFKTRKKKRKHFG